MSSQKSQGPQDLNPTPLSILGESQLPGPTVYRQDLPLCHMALRRLLKRRTEGNSSENPLGKSCETSIKIHQTWETHGNSFKIYAFFFIFILRTYSKHFISFMMILPQFTPEKCRFSSFQRGRAFRDAPVVVDVHGPWATGAVPVFLRPKGRQVLGGQADRSWRSWEISENLGILWDFAI